MIDAFGRRRLLSFDRDTVTGEPTVQVAHEALLARWPRLAGWIEDAREDLWTRRRLADAADDWIRAEHDQGFLLAGSRLDLFATWAATTDLRLDIPERELLDASLAERRRADEIAAGRAARERGLERRAATGLRAVVAVLAVAAILATSLAIVVYAQGETVREQQAVATARELAAGSIGNLGTDSRLSLLLAWASADATSDRGFVVEEAMDALHWALQASHVAYPSDATPVAIRAGPNGARGVLLLAPDRLMALAVTAAGRALTPEECRAYLHRPECPTPSTASVGLYQTSTRRRGSFRSSGWQADRWRGQRFAPSLSSLWTWDPWWPRSRTGRTSTSSWQAAWTPTCRLALRRATFPTWRSSRGRPWSQSWLVPISWWTCPGCRRLPPPGDGR